MPKYYFLEKGQVLSCQNFSELTVLSGEVWVTIQGDIKDYVLSKGQTFKMRPELLVVAQALEPTQILLIDSQRIPAANAPILAQQSKSYF